MNLNNALKWLENNNIPDENTCLITKLPIQNNITLKCGHCFEYNALLNNLLQVQKRNNNYHKCPYCRSIYKNYIPYYENNLNNYHDKYISNKKYYFLLDKNNNVNKNFFKNDYLTCSYIYKTGKNKGECCKRVAHNYSNGIYCTQHYKSEYNKKENNKCRCNKILKNGNQCKFNVFDNNNQLCKRHYNLSIKNK